MIIYTKLKIFIDSKILKLQKEIYCKKLNKVFLRFFLILFILMVFYQLFI